MRNYGQPLIPRAVCIAWLLCVLLGGSSVAEQQAANSCDPPSDRVFYDNQGSFEIWEPSPGYPPYEQGAFREPAAQSQGRRTVPAGVDLFYRPFGFDLSELTRFKPNDIQGLDLSWRPWVRFVDSDLAYLGGLTCLKSLGLSENPFTDDGLKSLKPLRNLVKLDLSFTLVKGEGLQHLQGFDSLQRLNLRWAPLELNALHYLKDFPALRHLDIGGFPLDDTRFRLISGLPLLESLRISDSRITDSGLEALRGMANLRHLVILNSPQITDSGMNVISSLSGLKELTIESNNLSDRCVVALQKMKSLQDLRLLEVRMSAKGIETLKKAYPNSTVEIRVYQMPPRPSISLKPLS